MNAETRPVPAAEVQVLEVDEGQLRTINTEHMLTQLKAAAGEDFKLGRYETAMALYERACTLLLSADTSCSSSCSSSGSSNGRGEMVSWVKRQYAVCKANAAQCSINLNLPSQAIHLASEAIQSDPLNVKALYRRAVASLAVSSSSGESFSSHDDDVDDVEATLLIQNAISDLRMALIIEPENKAVLKVISDAENIISMSKRQTQVQLHCSNQNLQPIHDCSSNSSSGSSSGSSSYDSKNASNTGNNNFPTNRSSVEAGPMTPASCMMYACLHGHLNDCVRLLDLGIDPRLHLPDGSTPLFLASERGMLSVVQLLLSRGASVLDKRADGTSPLFIASHEGHRQIVDLLLRHGAPVDEKDIKNGCTPLYVASLNGHLKCAALLLEAGANVNEIMLSDGATPLYIASREGRLAVVTLLVDVWKADINVKSKENTTPLFVAAFKGRLEVVEFLLLRKAELNHKSSTQSWSPLFAAAQMGHADVVKRLLVGGGRSFEIDSYNRSCVSAARAHGHEAIAQYLNAWPALAALACLADYFIYLDPVCVEDLHTFLGQGCLCNSSRCECNP